jgi:peptidoglycan/xylan/chitin deacetylase (PgdA/CDA1 family)
MAAAEKSRQIRRRRVAAVAVVLAVAAVLVFALGASGGKSVSGTATAAVDVPVVSAARADGAVRHLAKLGKPIYCGGRSKPYVALTFDDGPGPSTATAVNTLADLHVPATFFLLGQNVARARNVLPPGMVAANAIGSHTYHRVQLTALSLIDAGHEMANSVKAITAATHQPVRMLRPPNGARNAGVDAVARAEGLLQVHWDIDTKDLGGADGTLAGADGETIVATVAHHAKPGSIIQMHENNPETLAALRAVVAAVRAKHLRPVTVPQLMAVDPPSQQQIDAGPPGCGLPEPEPPA